jgi:hypothetical protein
MVSVVVFLTCNKLQSMMVDYAVTEFVCFDDYLDASPLVKTMRGTGFTVFILHIAQCMAFHKSKWLNTTLVAEFKLKSFYSKLRFKVIKDFAQSPIMEVARPRFHFEGSDSNVNKKKTIGMPCYHMMPGSVTLFFDNHIDKGDQSDLYHHLANDKPPKEWFLAKFIQAQVRQRIAATKVLLVRVVTERRK